MAKHRVVINLKPNRQWAKLLKDIDQTVTPVDVISESIVYLNNGDELSYDVKQMLDDGNTPAEVALTLNDEYDMYGITLRHIENKIDIPRLRSIIEPLTNSLLKDC